MQTRIPVVVATNYKGGVGKTTTTRVLAQALASDDDFTKGKPILVVDLDPQGNTSRRWRLVQSDGEGNAVPVKHPDLDGASSVCDLWMDILGEGGGSFEPEPYETSNPMIHCVPTYEVLMHKANALPVEKRELLGRAMVTWLRGEHIASKYSLVIIDTQPYKAPLIDAALVAATHCYIPFIPEPQSIEGVYSIIPYIVNRQSQRLDGTKLILMGVLPNMYQKNIVLHRTNLNALRKNEVFGRFVMPVELSRRIGYSETDDWRNSPDQVTSLEGTSIKAEAERFAAYIKERLLEV